MITLPHDRVITLLRGEEKSVCFTEDIYSHVPILPTPEALAAYEEQVRTYNELMKEEKADRERARAGLEKLRPVLVEGAEIRRLESQLKRLQGVIMAVNDERAQIERETAEEIAALNSQVTSLTGMAGRATGAEKIKLQNLAAVMDKTQEAKKAGLKIARERFVHRLNAASFKYGFIKKQLGQFSVEEREKIIAAYEEADKLRAQVRYVPGELVAPKEGYAVTRGTSTTCWSRSPETDFFNGELDRAEAAISDFTESLKKVNGVPKPFSIGEKAYLAALQKRKSRLLNFVYTNTGFVFESTAPEVTFL